jgi:hypothetical protein
MIKKAFHHQHSPHEQQLGFWSEGNLSTKLHKTYMIPFQMKIQKIFEKLSFELAFSNCRLRILVLEI